MTVRRNMIWIACLALALPVAPARAESSNRNDVRANLEKDGWRVVWGKNFTEGDWVEGTAAIAESVAAENPGPFLRWFGQVMDENFTKIENNLKGVARKDIERWIAQSLKQKKVITFKGFQIDAGFATYNRWQRTVVEVPDGIEWHGIHSKVKMKKVENKVPLPNWHQFYIRYKLVESGSGEVNPGNGGDKPSTFGIFINNKSGKKLKVFVRYQRLNGEWTTRTYDFAVGESARIDAETKNRYVYVRGEGRDYVASGGEGGVTAGDGRKYFQIHMGAKIGTHTHTFTP